MELNELKQHIQNHLSDGLAIIVGSGLSCAEGIPGMWPLAQCIINQAPQYPALNTLHNWQEITKDIEQKGLEAALLNHQLPADAEIAVMQITAEYLLEFENAIIAKVLAGELTLRFTRLLKHVLKPNTGIPVITTNYDRLLEIATEEAGLGVDTMFHGNYMGKLDQKESKFSQCRNVKIVSKSAKLVFRDHVSLYKPHGSFDWYIRDEKPLRFNGNLSVPRLMITPGINKFRNGYESPFDKHREEANKAIDKASRFLIIGYGFNDDHLETHLKPAIQSGKPTILLTHKVSPTARAMIKSSSAFIALEQGESGTNLITQTQDIHFPDVKLWDLNDVITGVLEP